MKSHPRESRHAHQHKHGYITRNQCSKQKTHNHTVEHNTISRTKTHSEKSDIRQMNAWPYKQECRGHDPRKKESVVCTINLYVPQCCIRRRRNIDFLIPSSTSPCQRFLALPFNRMHPMTILSTSNYWLPSTSKNLENERPSWTSSSNKAKHPGVLGTTTLFAGLIQTCQIRQSLNSSMMICPLSSVSSSVAWYTTPKKTACAGYLRVLTCVEKKHRRQLNWHLADIHNATRRDNTTMHKFNRTLQDWHTHTNSPPSLLVMSATLQNATIPQENQQTCSQRTRRNAWKIPRSVGRSRAAQKTAAHVLTRTERSTFTWKLKTDPTCGHDPSKKHRKSDQVTSANGSGKSQETLREDNMSRSKQKSPTGLDAVSTISQTDVKSLHTGRAIYLVFGILHTAYANRRTSAKILIHR